MQVLYAQTQTRIVFDVLNGRADVGFVRTDQIEGMEGLQLVDGSKFSPSMVQILQPKASFSQYEGTGKTFPFKSTTELTPEWPIGMSETTDTGARHPGPDAVLLPAN